MTGQGVEPLTSYQQQLLSPSKATDDNSRNFTIKDQISADIVTTQLKDLSLEVHTTMHLSCVCEPKN